VLCVALPAVAGAQTDVEELGRELGGARPPASYYDMLRLDPRAFRFSEENGWIKRGANIAQRRAASRATLSEQALFSPFASSSSADVVSGDVAVPVFLILYSNTDSAALVANVPRATLQTRLYGTDPAPPYSIHTYYREISNDSMRVSGTVLEWTRVSQFDTYYEAGCNGLCFTARGPFVEMAQQLVAAHDDSVDFGLFDNDGLDGIPNSSDDDGYVDAVVFLHPEVDGACSRVNPASEENIWAHRWSLQSSVSTADSSNSALGPSTIRVRDYIIQGGQGGDGGCDDDQPQAMGVVAHETGHLFGLPDLYDVSGSTQGIGHWGIMGSGNWNQPFSPAHMTAWTRARLGWVTEVLIGSDTVLDLSPIEVSDTAFIVPIADSDEYFLLENRQRIGSDAQLHGAGLLIWHVDSARIQSRIFTNSVNSSLPHGLSLEQADGQEDLQATSGGNRGDPGDPFPGTMANVRRQPGGPGRPVSGNDGKRTLRRRDKPILPSERRGTDASCRRLNLRRRRESDGPSSHRRTRTHGFHGVGHVLGKDPDRWGYIQGVFGNPRGRNCAAGRYRLGASAERRRESIHVGLVVQRSAAVVHTHEFNGGRYDYWDRHH
jgi:M6 family metalloprotease-like protein